jgi:N-acetylmuramate 1-kinase
MSMTHTILALDEAALERLAELAAFSIRRGDLIALSGDLGAGKSTFARAFIRALSGSDTVEVPSPTFTLVQTYSTARLEIAHFDLYRLTEPSEVDELGMDEAVAGGAAIVEWPERAGGRLPGARLSLAITETPGDTNTRDVALTGDAAWAARLARLIDIHAFLARTGHGGDRVGYLQGDASVRRYARLQAADGSRTILMDWPAQPDGPPIRDGLPYSKIAHLAEGVRPFVGIGAALAAAGFSAPATLAHDLDRGLLIEDFGDAVFGAEVAKGGVQSELWQAGVDTLVALRQARPKSQSTLPDGSPIQVPPYDARAMGIETELLIDWYWPALHASRVSEAQRAGYTGHWSAVFARLAAMPQGLVLRDYHSPNLLWLPDRNAPRNVGIIDFQDAQVGPHAYDLVSLLQDARVDVPAALEASLLARYCAQMAAHDPAFDEPAFRWSYAALGAQRNSKILGIFARLAHRDGKPQYLAHIPRIWRYLDRCLAHPELAGLADWYGAAFPHALRQRAISPAAPVLAVASA